MKYTKKLLSLVLVLVLALALAVPGFAADVTINSDHNKDATYKAYQLMTLTTKLICTQEESEGEGGHQHSDACYTYSYKINSKYDSALKTVTGVSQAETGKTLDQTIMDKLAEMGTDNGAENAEKARALAELLFKQVERLTEDATLTQGTAANLGEGYWLIVDSSALAGGELRSLVMLDTAGKEDITITAKDDSISLDKDVDGQESRTTANIGDIVTFTLESTLPSYLAQYDTYTFTINDTMGKGLTYFTDDTHKFSVTIDGTPVSVTPTVGEYNQTNGTQITVNLSSVINTDTHAGKKVVVTYYAKLNENAVIDGDGNPNKATLTYSNDYHSSSTGTTPETEVKVYTFDIDIFKYTGDSATPANALANAEFQLTKVVGGTTYYATATGDNGSYKISGWLAESELSETIKATTFVSPENGNIAIDGLEDGTYALTETKAPDGYNLLADPITFVIDNTGALTVGGESASVINVHNSTGSELPSTGGMGTTIFYTLGGVLVVGAAILLVTKKRVHDVEG